MRSQQEEIMAWLDKNCHVSSGRLVCLNSEPIHITHNYIIHVLELAPTVEEMMDQFTHDDFIKNSTDFEAWEMFDLVGLKKKVADLMNEWKEQKLGNCT